MIIDTIIHDLVIDEARCHGCNREFESLNDVGYVIICRSTKDQEAKDPKLFCDIICMACHGMACNDIAQDSTLAVMLAEYGRRIHEHAGTKEDG